MKIRNYLLLLPAILLLAGCSTKSNFYQLHTVEGLKSSHTTHIKPTVIGVSEVDLPEYLDKPEVVTRLSAGELKVHDTERWAGDFDRNIQSVISESLSSLLPQYTFMTYPWEEPIKERYRIYLSVERFDADANGEVTFEGRWSLVDMRSDRIVTGENIRYRLKGGMTMDEIVATQSRILAEVSRRIARKIRGRV